MDHAQAEYFGTLATVVVTFVGFSSVFLTFRQAAGGRVSRYDVLVTRTIVYYGVLIVLGALLPLLLTLFGLPPAAVARTAGATAALPALGYNIIFPRRRRVVTGRPTPGRVRVHIALVYAAVAALAAATVGWPAPPALTTYAAGLTILLGATFLAFLVGIDLLPSETSPPVDVPGARSPDR